MLLCDLHWAYHRCGGHAGLLLVMLYTYQTLVDDQACVSSWQTYLSHGNIMFQIPVIVSQVFLLLSVTSSFSCSIDPGLFVLSQILIAYTYGC